MWCNCDFSAPLFGGSVDFIGGMFGGRRDAWGFGGKVEPAALELCIADELSVGFSAGAHKARADSGDADAFMAQLRVEAFGEAHQRELGGRVGKHVRDGQFAADGRDIDDAGAAVAGEW